MLTHDLTPAQRTLFRHLAEETAGIDRPAYEAHGRDWRDPVIGLGPADAPLCLMGRDPGADEVKHGLPFIGAGGKKVRTALHRHLHPLASGDMEAPGPEAQRVAGESFFWLNTVPYKPIGNKAWSMAVKKRFHTPLQHLLLSRWNGRHVLTLGKEAFLWFGIGQPRPVRAQLADFWAQPGCFTGSIDVVIDTPQGTPRSFTLCPLPHPSPLNAVWAARFPGLLQQRLAAHAGATGPG